MLETPKRRKDRGSRTLWCIPISIISILWLLLIPLRPVAQSIPEAQATHHLTLTFSLPTDAFFYNSEFRGSPAPNFTLVGLMLTPSVRLALDKHINLRVGWHATIMAGGQRLFGQAPVAAVDASWTRVSLTIGTLQDSHRHGLPHFMEDAEDLWLSRPEFGVAVRLDYPTWLRLDLWLDLEKFIWKDSKDQERFVGGLLLRAGRPILTTRVLTMVKHQGGEIGATRAKAYSSLNGMLMLESQLPQCSRRIKPMLSLAGVYTRDASPISPLGNRRNGWAVWGKASLQLCRIKWEIGGFLSSRFQSIRGSNFFNSYADEWNTVYREKAHLLFSGLSYVQKWKMGSVHLKANLFYETVTHEISWSMKLILRADPTVARSIPLKVNEAH